VPLRFGYNTNGFAHHSLDDALRLIADLGYNGVALTLDVHHCNPFTASQCDLTALDRLLKQLKLAVVIETGARFILDPLRKHEPTLISPEPDARARRLNFLKRSVDIAQVLGAEAVSFWSGKKSDSVSESQAWLWLKEHCAALADYAANKGVTLAFEPEPEMFIAELSDLLNLKSQISNPTFGLTLDIGHYFITETTPFPEGFARVAPLVRNIHIEDIKNRTHEHLPFGAGDLPFPEILATLARHNYNGLVNVELSRDSHRAPEAAAASIQFLRAISSKML
jgi:sugar phosphate isomerase/epimerase